MAFPYLLIGSLAAGTVLSALPAGGAETLPSSAEAVSPILVGTAVPDGALKAASGEDTTLGELLDGQPAVLVFYRGHW